MVRTNAIRFSSGSSVPNLDFMEYFLIANPVEGKSEGAERERAESVLSFINQEIKQQSGYR